MMRFAGRKQKPAHRKQKPADSETASFQAGIVLIFACNTQNTGFNIKKMSFTHQLTNKKSKKASLVIVHF
jgi:hypothetical protein